jgi:isoquinoline 1-oxidoreductase beta subunit
VRLTRSSFLQTSGALVLAASAAGCARPDWTRTANLAPNALVAVTPSDRVVVYVGKSEIGQGVATGFATIVADELDARLDQIDVHFPSADEAYDDPMFHQLITGGSTSIAHTYDALRRAGATARAMLVSAAAQQWNVDPATCTVQDGNVVQTAGGRRARFGDLAARAATLAVPQEPTLKDTAAFRYIGKHVDRFDIPVKVDGSAVFGIDVRLPGMRYATVVHPPAFGAILDHFDASAAKRIRGVLDVFPIASGIAVVGEHTWAAFSGARALNVTWRGGATHSSDDLYAEAKALADDRGKHKVAVDIGNTDAAEGTTLSTTYRGPLLPHLAMEPMNATADVRADGVTVWAPTQVQTAARSDAYRASGVSLDLIDLRTTYVGGGFGRRLHSDFVTEAVTISKHIGAPVKLVWTREEDVQHDYYRPLSLSTIRGTLDTNGKLIALDQTIVSASPVRSGLPEYAGIRADMEMVRFTAATWPLTSLFVRGIDGEMLLGAADTPYTIPNMRIGYVDYEPGVPVGDLRAPGANWNTFVFESFLDELAHAANQDPSGFRRALITKSPRAMRVLDDVVARSGWLQRSTAGGHALGLALTFWAGSYAALVAEVSRAGDKPRVHRVWITADIGRVVNPDNAISQLQGGVIYGLSMALTKATLQNGRIAESNFNDFPVVRMADAPSVDAVLLASDEAPTGIGELGVPAVAPAVANALFVIDGKRIRDLPFV